MPERNELMAECLNVDTPFMRGKYTSEIMRIFRAASKRQSNPPPNKRPVDTETRVRLTEECDSSTRGSDQRWPD